MRILLAHWLLLLPFALATGCSCRSEDARFESAHPGKVKKATPATSVGVLRTANGKGGEAPKTDGTKLALDLSSDPQTNDARLKEMTFPPSLIEINLARTEVTDEGVADLKRVPNLEVLNLAHTKITSAVLKHLKEMPHLKRVIIVGPGITREDVAEMTRFLNARLPPDQQLSEYDVGTGGPPPGLNPSDFNR